MASIQRHFSPAKGAIGLLRIVIFLTALAAMTTAAQVTVPSSSNLTPPMGWNSWDSYGLSITEQQFEANVSWFTKHLQPFGWSYMVIDEGWYLQNPLSKGKPSWQYTMNTEGQYVPALNRFPSANGNVGFRYVADDLHSKGLRFGIHIIRGIPRQAVANNLPISGSTFHASEAADTSDMCAWNPDNFGVKANAAGQAYYDSLGKLYASWGVDFLKVDCISSPYKADEIHMISRALAKTGRPIVLSLSPGPSPIEQASDLQQHAQMWRVSNDLWDFWKAPADMPDQQTIVGEFDYLALWAPYRTPGHFPDADMLPLGYLGPYCYQTPRQTRLTPDEQSTVITLWSIARSPLFLGANLTRTTPTTARLLTNRELIEMNQHSVENREIMRSNGVLVWSARPEASTEKYLALFNLQFDTQKRNRHLASLPTNLNPCRDSR